MDHEREEIGTTASAVIDPTETKIGSFEFNHHAVDGYMSVTCWNRDHTGCGVHHVALHEWPANLAALERTRINRTARRERFDYVKRVWEPRSDF